MKLATLTLCDLAEHTADKLIVHKPISRIITKTVPFFLKCFVASAIEFDETEASKQFSLIYAFTDPNGSPIGTVLTADIYPHRPSNTFNYACSTIVELPAFGAYHLHLAVSGKQHQFKFAVIHAPTAVPFLKPGEAWTW